MIPPAKGNYEMLLAQLKALLEPGETVITGLSNAAALLYHGLEA